MKDGNTVSCCENKNVMDQNGNELRLCSAIDQERVQAEEEKNSTSFSVGSVTVEQPCPPNHTTAHFTLTLVSCTTSSKTLFKGYLKGDKTYESLAVDDLRKKCNAKKETTAIYDKKKPYYGTYTSFPKVCEFNGNEWGHNLGSGYMNLDMLPMKCMCND